MKNYPLIPTGMPPISSFEAYRFYINNIPSLSEEDEIALVKKFKEENCINSAQKLIISQLKTVLYLASKYKGYGLPQEDLVQEGNIGLMRAVKNFDLKYNVRLYTYALIWIKSEIQSYILKNWKIVRIATTNNLKKLFFNFKGTQKELMDLGVSKQELIRNLANKLEVTESEVIDIQSYFTFEDISIEDNNDENKPFDIAYDKTPELEYEEKHDNFVIEENLKKGIEKLSSNQKEVLRLRFYEEPKKTHKEISTILNLSSERVRQIEKEALDKLKKLVKV
jgi:RNA polymerase sigma-32 factor